MALIAVWLEGAHHPFEDQKRWYESFLTSRGHCVVFPSISELLSDPRLNADLWILGGLVYSGMGEAYQPLCPEEADALISRIDRGLPLLALHSVVGSWDERPELDSVWDGRWDWSESRHSPIEPFQVRVTDPEHPLNEGLSDFVITDELYYNLHPPLVSTVVLSAEYEGRTWPLAWASPNRVYFGLGHDLRSLENPNYGVFVSNALKVLLA
jgi:uncharacterized protein